MRFTRRIKNKFKTGILPRLIKFSAALNWPALTAALIAAGIEEVNSHGEYVVLCLRRSVFMDDVWAMVSHSGRIRYLVMERSYLRSIMTHFLSYAELKEFTENNYHTTPVGLAGKKKYYQYLRRVLPILRKKIGFQAICSGNFGYVEQQELMRLCEDLRLPFVVFHKEGLIAGFFEGANEMYRGRKFLGRLLLIYNEKIIKALLGKVSGLTSDKIRLVGVPRFDHYHKRAIPVRPQIVFFSFYIKNWMSKIMPEAKGLKAAEARARAFHDWVLNFAIKHPEVDVIVKTKAADFYLEYAKETFSDEVIFSLPNLSVINSGDPVELIKKSQAVLGYNSMVLIEALIAGKPIFSPFFGDLVGSQTNWDYFNGYAELVNYVRDAADLEQKLLSSQRFVSQGGNRIMEFVGQFVYRPDGRASERAEKEIIQVIEEFDYVNS